MFDRIKDLHKIGLIHRDIKLNNFVINNILIDSNYKISSNEEKEKKAIRSEDVVVNLIDYGICKKPIDEKL
jgi:serine/threonine protein kinase